MSTLYEEKGLIATGSNGDIEPGPDWKEFTSGFALDGWGPRTLETVEALANIAANMVIAASRFKTPTQLGWTVEGFGHAVEPPLSPEEHKAFKNAAERLGEEIHATEARRQAAAEEQIRLGLA